MTASPVTAPATTGYPTISAQDNEALRHIHARRCSAALIFAQETMNGHEDRAASAFADYYEASVEHQLLWNSATRAARQNRLF
jgi:hypothetical protein